MKKVTLDTNCLIRYKEKDDKHVARLIQLAKKGKISLRVTTRGRSDVEGDKNKQRKQKMLNELSKLPVLGTGGRYGVSYWDGGDFYVGEDYISVEEKVKRCLFPNLRGEPSKFVRKLIDVDHLMGHLWGKRDYFVTYDRNFLRKRDKLYTICGAVVCTPQECPKKIEEGGVQMAEKEVGRVSDFFARPVVAGIELTAPLKVGDKIHIKGHTTEMEMVVESMQINNVDVKEAKPGDAIGIKVPDRVRRGDQVYKVTE